MLDEQYLYSIHKMEEAGHFDETGKCNYCGAQIAGITVFETEGGMSTHLKDEHGITIE